MVVAGLDPGWGTIPVEYQGNLIAGGLNGAWKWDGSTWTALTPGLSGYVRNLEVYHDTLVACGDFPDRVRYWTGTAWLPLGGGVGSGVVGNALLIHDGKLHFGGSFSQVGGVPANNIAVWNGTSWGSVGGGTTARVHSLTVYAGELIAGGEFTGAGGVPANHVAAWNGTSWQALGAGVDGLVLAMGSYRGNLYAGGEFTATGGSPVAHIAAWNGATWFGLGSGTNSRVRALLVYGDRLYVGGEFTQAGAQASQHLGRWWVEPQVGACCQAEGVCTVTTQTGCSAPSNWHLEWTSCDPNPCPGACCNAATFDCAMTTQANCVSPDIWHPDWPVCAPCLDPEGVADMSGPGADGILNAVPNPFSTSPVLWVRLSRPARIRLAVFDSGGRAIRELEVGMMGAGTHSIVWDGRGSGGNPVSPRVYFARISAGKHFWTRALIRIK